MHARSSMLSSIAVPPHTAATENLWTRRTTLVATPSELSRHPYSGNPDMGDAGERTKNAGDHSSGTADRPSNLTIRNRSKSMIENSKVRSSHTHRAAIVYIRQSHPSQVENNRESTARQYALVEKAIALGWNKKSSDHHR